MRIVCAYLVVLSLLAPAEAQRGVARARTGNTVGVGNRSANANRSANVNRNANVNQNINVNRNVNVNTNVHGGYYGGGCCYDNSWNWGSFAVGAAAGAVTTAAVSAAAHSSSTTVVAAPVGSVVTTLPGSCAAVGSGGAVVYNCNQVYYQPFYQGTTLVYQVVKYP